MPARHQTLRATVEWSVGLLDDAEPSLLETAAVFVDGWTIEAPTAASRARSECGRSCRDTSPLKGRDEERTTLDELLDAIRAGENRALVVHGEPGVAPGRLRRRLSSASCW
jgi:hypothetical protein